jgi:hypothetical protein
VRLLLSLVLSLLAACNPAGESPRSIFDVTRASALVWNDGLHIPPNATHVYGYEKVGGLQNLELFYRFTVPVTDVEAAVDHITTANQKQMKFGYTFERTSTLPPTYNWPHWAKPTIAWWQPDLIVMGFYKGTTESYGVRVWADTRSGMIFVYQTD